MDYHKKEVSFFHFFIPNKIKQIIIKLITKVCYYNNFHFTGFYWRAKFWYQIGRCNEDQQHYLEGEKAYQTSLRYIEDNNDEIKDNQSLSNLKGMIHHQIGVIKYQMGENETAISHYDKSLKILGDESPEYATTLMSKGTSLFHMNKLGEAIQHYNDCFRIWDVYHHGN